MVMFYSKIIQGAQYYRSKVLKYQKRLVEKGESYFFGSMRMIPPF